MYKLMAAIISVSSSFCGPMGEYQEGYLPVIVQERAHRHRINASESLHVIHVNLDPARP